MFFPLLGMAFSPLVARQTPSRFSRSVTSSVGLSSRASFPDSLSFAHLFCVPICTYSHKSHPLVVVPLDVMVCRHGSLPDLPAGPQKAKPIIFFPSSQSSAWGLPHSDVKYSISGFSWICLLFKENCRPELPWDIRGLNERCVAVGVRCGQANG